LVVISEASSKSAWGWGVPFLNVALQLGAILAGTMESMMAYDYKDIATIAISLAKVMQQVESHGQKAADSSLYQTIYNLLLGEASSKGKHYIFSEIAIISLTSAGRLQLWASHIHSCTKNSSIILSQ
jgi:hypothetical protein